MFFCWVFFGGQDPALANTNVGRSEFGEGTLHLCESSLLSGKAIAVSFHEYGLFSREIGLTTCLTQRILRPDKNLTRFPFINPV